MSDKSSADCLLRICCASAATLALRSVTLSVYMLMCVALLAGGAGGRTP